MALSRSAMTALAAAVLLSCGCSSGAGGLTLFPTSQRLLREARDVRDSMSQPVAVPTELQKLAYQPYIIQPGDVLLIEPLELDSPLRLPVDQTVLVDGTIDLGRYGRHVVAGQTVEQMETQVAAAIRDVEGTDVPINVRLTNPDGAVYYVLGEVRAPGSYPLVGRETVLDGLMTAGGLDERASRCEIILSRPTLPYGCRVVLPVCYDRIVQLGDTATNYQLQPGDRIFVATRTLHDSLRSVFARHDCPNCCGPSEPCYCPPATMAPVEYLPALPPAQFETPLDGEPPPAAPQPAPEQSASFSFTDRR